MFNHNLTEVVKFNPYKMKEKENTTNCRITLLDLYHPERSNESFKSQGYIKIEKSQ